MVDLNTTPHLYPRGGFAFWIKVFFRVLRADLANTGCVTFYSPSFLADPNHFYFRNVCMSSRVNQNTRVQCNSG